MPTICRSPSADSGQLPADPLQPGREHRVLERRAIAQGAGAYGPLSREADQPARHARDRTPSGPDRSGDNVHRPADRPGETRSFRPPGRAAGLPEDRLRPRISTGRSTACADTEPRSSCCRRIPRDRVPSRSRDGTRTPFEEGKRPVTGVENPLLKVLRRWKWNARWFRRQRPGCSGRRFAAIRFPRVLRGRLWRAVDGPVKAGLSATASGGFGLDRPTDRPRICHDQGRPGLLNPVSNSTPNVEEPF